MLEKIGAGLGIVLLASFLPNVIATSVPDVPLTLQQQVLAKQTQESSALGTVSNPVAGKSEGDGDILVGHTPLFLQRVTAYNAVAWQTNSDPAMSACGPTRPNQIALSQDLFFRPDGGNRCGEQVEIVLRSGQVIRGVVWDTMNARYHMAADILMGNVQQAVDFGVHQARLRILSPRQTKPINS
ncbi:MAG: hypothetical protein JJ693_04445 [Acidithiobacillus sp.]|nr:hypothetical protein [Acidithiobacillus sp.]